MNVAFPLVSLARTVVVNVADPPLVVFVNDLPSKVPVKLPRSVPSVSRLTVMVLLAFAKLSPEELAILRDVTVIGYGSIINYDSAHTISRNILQYLYLQSYVW